MCPGRLPLPFDPTPPTPPAAHRTTSDGVKRRRYMLRWVEEHSAPRGEDIVDMVFSVGNTGDLDEVEEELSCTLQYCWCRAHRDMHPLGSLPTEVH